MKCVVVRAPQEYGADRDARHFTGISAQRCGSRSLAVVHYLLRPKGVVSAHRHDGHESGLFVVSGIFGVWAGDDLQHFEEVRAGDFVFIPMGAPHRLINPSTTNDAIGILARSAAAEPEGLTELPRLEAKFVAGSTDA